MRVDARALCKISIHALRVEGDTVWQLDAQDDTDFYPRPPGGGRQLARDCYHCALAFLSTPSGWRATVGGMW